MTKVLIELEVNVTGTYTKGDPGIHTYSNGDPGYPPEPSSFDIDKVTYNNKDITDILTSDDLYFIEDSIMNGSCDDDDDFYDFDDNF